MRTEREPSQNGLKHKTLAWHYVPLSKGETIFLLL